MPKLGRDGQTPRYGDYVCWGCIVVSPDKLRADFDTNLKATSPPDGPRGLKIPSWQRKIVWGEKHTRSLISTESDLIGTAILAKMNPQDQNEQILIDGLQRFATGTAMLNVLYDFVVKDPPELGPSVAAHFQPIKSAYQSQQPVYAWNHDVLLNHTRRGIQSSYARLFQDVKTVIKEQIDQDPAKAGLDLTRTLMQRQVAVDPYGGFSHESELISTFFDINSSGEPLSKIDLLRAKMVGHMQEMQENARRSGNPIVWSDSEVENFENEFTAIFAKGGKGTVQWVNTLGIHMYEVMYTDEDFTITPFATAGGGGITYAGHKPQYIFPNWDTLDTRTIDEFIEYLNAVEKVATSRVGTAETEYQRPFLALLHDFKIPFCAIIWFYWKYHYVNYVAEKIRHEKRLVAAKLGVDITELEQRIQVEQNSGQPDIELAKAQVEAKEEVQKITDSHAVYKFLLKERDELKLVMAITKANGEDPTVEQDARLEEINRTADATEQEEEVGGFQGLFADSPDFLGGDLDTMEDIRFFYRATIRQLIHGDIGRQNPLLHGVMNERITNLDVNSTIPVNTVARLAEYINPDDAGSLQQPPAPTWCMGRLNVKSDVSIKHIFNACLLPDRTQTINQHPFKPLIWSTKTGFWNIDHLIPDSSTNVRKNISGEAEIQRIVNFAPLETEKNKQYSNLVLSQKFANGAYDVMARTHPYCDWLINVHLPQRENDQLETDQGPPQWTGLPIDNQRRLVEGDGMNISNDRIQALYNILSTKL